MYRLQLTKKISLRSYWIDSAVSILVKDYFKEEELLKLNSNFNQSIQILNRFCRQSI